MALWNTADVLPLPFLVKVISKGVCELTFGLVISAGRRGRLDSISVTFLSEREGESLYCSVH